MEKPIKTSTPVAASASASGSSAAGYQGDHIPLVLEKTAATQIMSGQGAIGYVSLSPPAPAPAPLTLSFVDGTVLVDEEPDSPTSPGSCTISPEGYTPLTRTFCFAEYGPRSVNRELCYNAKSSTCTATCPAMDESIHPIQDGEPLIISDDLECDMYPPDYSVDPWFAVRQATEFAEIALRCHNNDPSAEVKYELVKATMSNYLFEGSENFGHVNFTSSPRGQSKMTLRPSNCSLQRYIYET